MSNSPTFSGEQISQIQSWADDGDGLAAIQSKLDSEMETRVTYMELRFLLEDLGIHLKPDPAPEKTEEPEETHSESNDESTAAPDAADAVSEPNSEDEGSEVSVTVDQVQRPGTMISGSVSFGSEGQSAEWSLDQLGRLGLNPKNEGFRPSEEQIKAFQEELQKVIQKSGL